MKTKMTVMLVLISGLAWAGIGWSGPSLESIQDGYKMAKTNLHLANASYQQAVTAFNDAIRPNDVDTNMSTHLQKASVALKNAMDNWNLAYSSWASAEANLASVENPGFGSVKELAEIWEVREAAGREWQQAWDRKVKEATMLAKLTDLEKAEIKFAQVQGRYQPVKMDSDKAGADLYKVRMELNQLPR